MRIALYARKSTEQEDRQIQSLDDQLRELGKLAEREHLQIVETFVESKSAKTPGGRPEFERLMKGIEQERFEGVLCWSINRLSRNPVDGGRIAYLLQTGKLSVIRTVERTYRPEDNALLLSIENGMATAYLQDLSRNVKRGMRGRIERGWHSSKPPVGYRNDPETRQIVVDSVRYDLVRRGWDMLLSGDWTVTAIWRELRESGLTVHTRRTTPSLISRVGLFHLFENPFYMGKVPFHGELHDGKHQPMVTAEEFRKAQRLIHRKLKKSVNIGFAFSRVFTCENCGCAVIGERRLKVFGRSGRTVEYIYYHCSGSKGCPKTAVRQEELETRFEDIVNRIKLPKPVGEWLQDATVQLIESTGAQDAQDYASLDTQRIREEQRLARLTMMRTDGELSADEYRVSRTAVLISLQEVAEKIALFREASTSILRKAHELIQVCIDAGELQGGPADPFALGHFARACGEHALNLNTPIIRLHPVLQKIATFELPESGSEMPKRGDFLPSSSKWWSLAADILNLLRDADAQDLAQFMQSLHK